MGETNLKEIVKKLGYSKLDFTQDETSKIFRTSEGQDIRLNYPNNLGIIIVESKNSDIYFFENSSMLNDGMMGRKWFINRHLGMRFSPKFVDISDPVILKLSCF